ncbi:MAG: hypothetical protein EOO24_00815 [Comamonadaceae bacterium]|nr:MAG: hypothetical protein EOO24_00815 [Comamonadaceae bacterium]
MVGLAGAATARGAGRGAPRRGTCPGRRGLGPMARSGPAPGRRVDAVGAARSRCLSGHALGVGRRTRRRGRVALRPLQDQPVNTDRSAVNRHAQSGRTLLELLVAMTLLLVVVGLGLSIWFATGSSSRHAAVIARMNEEALLAHALLGQTVRMAGFSLPRRQVPAGGARVNGILVRPPDRNFTGAGIRGCDFGFLNPGVSDFEALACRRTAPGEPAFAIRFEAASPGDPASVRALQPEAEDCLGQGVATDAIGALSRPQRLVESRYLMRVGATSGTPELFCAGRGNGYAAYPLFQFVEGLSVRYGIAADGQARALEVAGYRSAAEVDALPGTLDERWSRVIAVRLCLLMRGGHAEGSRRSTYVDCDGRERVAPDAALRRAYPSVVALRNRSGFAAAPP